MFYFREFLNTRVTANLSSATIEDAMKVALALSKHESTMVTITTIDHAKKGYNDVASVTWHDSVPRSCLDHDLLTAEYTRWLKSQKLPMICAEELLHYTDINQAQREWLSDFVLRWDAVNESNTSNTNDEYQTS